MRTSGRILFVLGFVIAILSAVGLYWVFINTKPAPPTVPTSKVVVAFQNVEQRSEISAAQVGAVDWPETVPTPAGAYDASSEVIGKLAKAQISPGQPILNDMLLDKGDVKEQHSNASLILDDRMRAIAVPVRIDTNVAQAVQAGDRVDFVATFTVQPKDAQGQSVGPEGTTTHHLLQDVLVLQVGPWVNSDAAPAQNQNGNENGEYSIITLQVNLQDAEVLKYAQLKADDVSLALRKANDHNIEESEPVTIEYINKRFGYQFPILGR